MTKEEFVKRIGIQCSDSVFEKYNKKYMESDLDKDDFCKGISKNEIAMEMQWEIMVLKRELENLRETIKFLYEQASDCNMKNYKLRCLLNKIKEDISTI